jgi:hypothetical protein
MPRQSRAKNGADIKTNHKRLDRRTEMKTKSILEMVLIVGVCLLLTAAYGAEKREIKADPNGVMTPASAGTLPRGVREPAGRAGGITNRNQMYQEAMARRMTEHQAAMAELEAIKKIAEEENAARTVEAIQKLIDEKNARFKQSLEQVERQRRERLEQIQQRTPTPKARDVQKEQTDTSEKKADPAK